MSAPVIELRDVQVAFAGRTVLEVPRLGVGPGESLVLLGPNGAGKSTLLGVMGLLARPNRGQVLLAGERVANRGRARLEARRRTAYVHQEPLLRRASVAHNVAQGLRFRRVARPLIERRVTRWLEILKISHLRDRQADTLSGGEAQRTSLARALVLEPDVLLLDEPFAALDAPGHAELRQDFRQALVESGTAIVFATHDRDDALILADRVAVLFEGRVAQVDGPEAVFTRPGDEAVARFVGAETLIPGHARGVDRGLALVECAIGNFQVVHEGITGPVYLCIRPENVHLIVADEVPRQSARNTVRGRISKILPLESHLRVTIDCGAPITALVTRASMEELALAEGTAVLASFKATAAHVIPRRRQPAG